MTIIAQSGPDHYLIATSADEGRVLDTEQKVLHRPFNIHSLLARGYWEAYSGPQEALGDLLHGVYDATQGQAP